VRIDEEEGTMIDWRQARSHRYRSIRSRAALAALASLALRRSPLASP
jgi:hypothetical protein